MYFIVDFICMGLLNLSGSFWQTEIFVYLPFSGTCAVSIQEIQIKFTWTVIYILRRKQSYFSRQTEIFVYLQFSGTCAVSIQEIKNKVYMNSDLHLETKAVIVFYLKQALARCISLLISFAWAYSTCQEVFDKLKFSFIYHSQELVLCPYKKFK